jgi:hypothetical protein
VVVVLPTAFQLPETRRWILTGTLATQAVNPSPTLTTPLATRCFFRLNVTLLEWAVLTVKFAALVAVPPGVVTLIFPVVAPVGTVAVICVAEFTVNEVAVVVLNFTEVVVKPVPLKFVPVILTDVPTGPKAGVNEVIVGAATTTKSVVLVAVPMVFVTLILPVVAPVGTIAVIDVAEFSVKEVAVVLLNLTAVVHPKFVPVMATLVPMGPTVGVKEVMVGAAAVPTTKTEALAVSAPGVWTVIFPVVAPAGTAAVTVVSVRPVSVDWSVVLKVTAVAPVNPVPVIATDVVTGPHVGVKLVTVDADAGRAVSPTINVTPTSETNTRTDARLPECRPTCFMASTSLSPPLGMGRCSISPIEPDLAYHSWTPSLR